MSADWTPDPRTLEWAAKRIRADRCEVDGVTMEHAAGMLDVYADRASRGGLARHLAEEDARFTRAAHKATR